MDRFPEAFERFEETVDTDYIISFRQLKSVFSLWAGRNWKDTPAQNAGLRAEAERMGILKTHEYVWKSEGRRRFPRFIHRVPPSFILGSESSVSTASVVKREVVTVRGRGQVRYRNVKSGRFMRKPHEG